MGNGDTSGKKQGKDPIPVEGNTVGPKESEPEILKIEIKFRG
jgi:hypothetical protein